jgi:hypothetical protein
MLPFQGLLADIFAVIALIRFWRTPLPWMWWTTLGLFVLELLSTRALKQSLQTNGPRAAATIVIGILCTLLQLALIALGVYSFFR